MILLIRDKAKYTNIKIMNSELTSYIQIISKLCSDCSVTLKKIAILGSNLGLKMQFFTFTVESES